MRISLFFVVLMPIFFEQVAGESHDDKKCRSQCGNVTIEKPFGIGPNCSKNEYFTVTCDYSSLISKPKPILTKFNFELLKWTTYYGGHGQIMVNVPVAEACAEKNYSSSLDLSGSPFYISNKNVFVSIGCDGFASLHNKTGGVIGGCISTCNRVYGETIGKGCYGYRCCQSNIWVTGTDQTLSTRISVGTKGSCRSAFIVSEEYLNSNDTNVSAIAHSVVAPVVLYWSIHDHDDNPSSDVLGAVGIAFSFIGIACTTIPFTCCCFWACWCHRTKHTRKELKLRAKYFKGRLEQNSSNREVVYKTKLFTLKELKKATDNFSCDRVIGEGGQGTVYKGTLINGPIIAVKKSKVFEESQWKEFINEVILLSQLNYRNIVKLLGCCLETKLPLLVYEFIPNGTLSQHIHNATDDGLLLTWELRVSIATEIAGAISYLHSSSLTPIYHRDIKSTNILLDDKFQSKVSDFGISKVVPMDQTHLTTCVRGTFGYLDPEYFRSSKYSEKSDVYSFGVVLVELLTGQYPIRETSFDEEKSLVVYFMSAMNESTLDKILDPLVLEGSTKEEVMVVANVVKQCLNSRGANRPTMKEVAMELERVKRKSSSSKYSVHQESLEIKDATSMCTTVIDNAYTTSAMQYQINACYDYSIEEQHLFNTTL